MSELWKLGPSPFQRDLIFLVGAEAAQMRRVKWMLTSEGRSQISPMTGSSPLGKAFTPRK